MLKNRPQHSRAAAQTSQPPLLKFTKTSEHSILASITELLQ